MSARAFQRVFTCKIWLRYSRERALKSSKVRALWNLNLNFKILNLLFAAQITLCPHRPRRPHRRRRLSSLVFYQ